MAWRMGAMEHPGTCELCISSTSCAFHPLAFGCLSAQRMNILPPKGSIERLEAGVAPMSL